MSNWNHVNMKHAKLESCNMKYTNWNHVNMKHAKLESCKYELYKQESCKYETCQTRIM